MLNTYLPYASALLCYTYSVCRELALDYRLVSIETAHSNVESGRTSFPVALPQQHASAALKTENER
eukprot:3161021-Pleurochrysis_carterae.AAC.3